MIHTLMAIIDDRLLLEANILAAIVVGVYYLRQGLARRLAKAEELLRLHCDQISMMRQRGIYTIYCRTEDASYLGSTEINFHVRWGQHITLLEKGEHTNPRLQQAWRTYGRDDFEFMVAESIDDIEDIRPRETEHLEYRAMNLPARQNYNVNNSRMRRGDSIPELQFVYPTKIVQKIIRKPAKRPRLQQSYKATHERQ